MPRVLVIDDNLDIRDYLQTLLEGAGYHVAVAADGSTAVTQQRSDPVDLVLTDIFMPNRDGIETIAELHAEFPALKIIAMSGGSVLSGGQAAHIQSYLLMAREVGASRTLSKPFGADELLALVRELVPTPA